MRSRAGKAASPSRTGPVSPAQPSALTPEVAAYLQRKVGNGVLQRHIKNKSYIDYGGTNTDGVGTTMEAEFWPSWKYPAGSKPSVEPNWWPHNPDIAAPFFKNYMVQGHLLNNNIGGTGSAMKNLTPITRSANTMHEKKIENIVKARVFQQADVVDYHVYADYSYAPRATELAPNESPAVQQHIENNYVDRLPHQIVAEFTAWKQTNNGWKDAGDRWKIGNEAKEIF